MIVEMKQLEYFIVCCDCGSFSKAAQVLYTTQPNVSKVICQMETQLNCSLFNRKGRGISLTEMGKKIYRYALSIIENAENISELLNQESEKIFSVASVPSNYMSNTLKAWYETKKENYQHIRYLEGSLKEVVDYVKRYEVDLGFVYVSYQHLKDFTKSLKNEELKFIEMSEAVQVIAIGQKNPFFAEESISKEMLKQIQFIHYQDRNLTLLKDVLLMNQIIEDSGDRHRFITNSENVILNLVENTDLALLSVGRKCDSKETERKIRHIPLSDAHSQISFGYVIREDTILTNDMKEFIGQMSE